MIGNINIKNNNVDYSNSKIDFDTVPLIDKENKENNSLGEGVSIKNSTLKFDINFLLKLKSNSNMKINDKLLNINNLSDKETIYNKILSILKSIPENKKNIKEKLLLKLNDVSEDKKNIDKKNIYNDILSKLNDTSKNKKTIKDDILSKLNDVSEDKKIIYNELSSKLNDISKERKTNIYGNISTEYPTKLFILQKVLKSISLKKGERGELIIKKGENYNMLDNKIKSKLNLSNNGEKFNDDFFKKISIQK